jgi:hypothetical protein
VLLRPSGPAASQGGLSCRGALLLSSGSYCCSSFICVPTLWRCESYSNYCCFCFVAALPGAGVSASPSSGAMQQEQALLEALGRWADRLAMVNEVFGSKIV